MATSPNFNWPEPDNTDLVRNGALAIRTAVNAIDTSLVDLKGGTTGQVLSKASGTDMDFTWVTDAAGDITGVTAGTGISGGGTSGTVTVTNSMATAIDAKGDLIGGTGADTFARLAVGANGTILTADSAEATGMKWAAAAGATSMPAFSATKDSSDQSLGTSTYTKVTFATENFDTANCYSSNRFTPNVAGYYQMTVQIYLSNATAGLNQVTLYKNGTRFIRVGMFNQASNGQYQTLGGTALMYLNGTTDYVEVYAYTDAGAGTAAANAEITIFSGVGVKS
jgi:hypothetical protein